MLFYLILLFTLIPIIEFAVLLRVGSIIGLSSTLMIVIITGVVGAYLARSQGLKILYSIQNEVNQGKMPADKIFDGVLVFMGGVLLLTPGLITDAIGFIVLIPFTRELLKRCLKAQVKKMISKGKVKTYNYSSEKTSENIIDVEYREEE